MFIVIRVKGYFLSRMVLPPDARTILGPETGGGGVGRCGPVWAGGAVSQYRPLHY